MHILFLSDNFPPEVNAPASRTFEHCREWVKAGHRVTVVTGFPNFPQGRIYPGYRSRLWQREDVDGVGVVRVWTYIAANEGFVKRVVDYASYMFAAVLASIFIRPVDIVVGTSPQFFAVCAAWAVGRLKRVPFVFELRDLWPESIKAVGAMKNSPFLRPLEKMEMFLYCQADIIISVTESFKRVLASRGVDPAKIEVVVNGVDTTRFRPRPKDPELLAQHGLEGKLVAGYIGTHGMAHALETVLESAKLIRERPGGDSIRFLLLGDGARKKALKEKAGAIGLDNVLFMDSVPKEDVSRYWSLLDVSIIHLRKNELFKTLIPSKMFESAGMGIPILLGVEGESASILARDGIGLGFEPENPRALVEGLIKISQRKDLYEGLKENCLRAAPGYDRRQFAAKMLAVLKKTAVAGQ